MKTYLVTLQYGPIKFTSTIRAKTSDEALNIALDGAEPILDNHPGPFDDVKIECQLLEEPKDA